jgi:hypothetical protein
MRFPATLILILTLLTLAACGTTETAQGGGSEDRAGGRIKVGVPF